MLTLVHAPALLLAPLPWLLRLLCPPVVSADAALPVPFYTQLYEAAGRGDRAIRRWPTPQRLLLLLAWCALLLALARPVWLGPAVQQALPARDLLLALDLSQSMATADFLDQRGEPASRLAQVRSLLSEFLYQRKGDRIGLVVFGSSAFVHLPPTTDSAVVQQLLQEVQVGMAGPRTQIGDAIGLAMSLFAASDLPQQVLLLITDGNDTGSALPPLEVARIAAARGITLHAIGIGDPRAAGERPLDEQMLGELAALTGGSYFRARDTEALAAVYAELDRLTPSEVQVLSERPRRELFHWPLGVAWLLLLALPLMARRSDP